MKVVIIYTINIQFSIGTSEITQSKVLVLLPLEVLLRPIGDMRDSAVLRHMLGG